mmetsp:Transcript_24479/g.78990  ORF Transcript_24479/g.78990 Transcript_24479/m.78990 type:complete len:221 (-) Transcript_24479:2265-2927(-)
MLAGTHSTQRLRRMPLAQRLWRALRPRRHHLGRSNHQRSFRRSHLPPVARLCQPGPVIRLPPPPVPFPSPASRQGRRQVGRRHTYRAAPGLPSQAGRLLAREQAARLAAEAEPMPPGEGQAAMGGIPLVFLGREKWSYHSMSGSPRWVGPPRQPSTSPIRSLVSAPSTHHTKRTGSCCRSCLEQTRGGGVQAPAAASCWTCTFRAPRRPHRFSMSSCPRC